MTVGGIKDAVPLIHGPAGCASLRQMDSFDVSGRVPHAPCKNLPGIDLDPVAIHQEYVDFQGTDFDYGGVTYSCIRCQRRVDGDNIIRR